MNTRKQKKRRAGFTLVELLVVIAIVAILGSVAIPKLMGNTEKARKARAISEINALKLAADAFQLDKSVPIASLQELVPARLEAVPKDPWGGDYVVEVKGDDVKIRCPNLESRGGGIVSGTGAVGHNDSSAKL